jgi:hypothetical protein
MSVSPTIIWIDDNPARHGTASNLGATFINVKDQDLAGVVEDLLQGRRPGLVIIDHVLDKTATTDRLFQRGSTIAEAIKEQWPACPVIGITNADVDVRTKSTYDALFSYPHFSNYFDYINALQSGFAAIGRIRHPTIDKLVQLLSPPTDDAARLKDSLPDKLKMSIADQSLPSRYHRWVEHVMERPGFLLDEAWASTVLGLTEVGFRRTARTFENAKYDRIFASAHSPRWWASRLVQILTERCSPVPGELSWHMGRKLPGITQQHFSRCYSCHEEFPEIVAFLDEASNERHPMHLKCTVPHPRYKRELYFEDIRMMEGR